MIKRNLFLLVLMFVGCSSVEQQETVCDPSPNKTIVIDHVCSPTCAIAHSQPSPYKGETAGSIPLFGCYINLDDVKTDFVVDCSICHD